MVAVQASVLAIEAGRTVILDREEVFSHAKAAGISIVGKTAQVQAIQPGAS
jgi:DUF1009 family protein